MSTYLDFTDKVRAWLITKYQVEYTGKLGYTTYPIPDSALNYYALSWGLNQETYPFIMQGEFSDEEAFYAYVVKQIAYTKFFETRRFIAYRIGQANFLVPDFKDPLLTFDELKIKTC